MRPSLALALVCLCALAALAWIGTGASRPAPAIAVDGDGAAQPAAESAPTQGLEQLADASRGAPDELTNAARVHPAPRGWKARIQGLLVDERTGARVAHTWVHFVGGDGPPATVETDASGRFTSVAAFPAGEVLVTLQLAEPTRALSWSALLWHHPESARGDHPHPVPAGPRWLLGLELDEGAREVGNWHARVFLEPEPQPGWPDDPETEPGYLVSPHALRFIGSRGTWELDVRPPEPRRDGAVVQRDGRWSAAFPPLPGLLATEGPFVLEVYGGPRDVRALDGTLRPSSRLSVPEYRARVHVAALDGGGPPLVVRPVASGELHLALVDDLGAPLDGGEVWLAAEGSRLQPERQRRARAAAGACVLRSLPPDRYTVHARVPGHTAARADVDVAAGVATAHELVLARVRRDGRITGTLTSSSGAHAGATRIEVTAVAADQPGSEPEPRIVDVVWSDERGRSVGTYACAELPAGDYRVEVVGGYLQPWAPPAAHVHTGRGRADFRLVDDATVDVRVRVLEAETGQPLVAARLGVHARRGARERSFGRNWEAARMADGALVLTAIAADVELEIEASARGRERRRLSRTELAREVRADGGVELVATLRLPLSDD